MASKKQRFYDWAEKRILKEIRSSEVEILSLEIAVLELYPGHHEVFGVAALENLHDGARSVFLFRSETDLKPKYEVSYYGPETLPMLLRAISLAAR